MNPAGLTADGLNLKLFSVLNAENDASSLVVASATALADYAIYMVPVTLAGLWLWGKPQRRGTLLTSFAGAELALALNQAAGLIWFHPRPFMIPVGNTLIEHAADSSFPSDHLTFMAAVAIGLWFLADERLAAIVTAVLGAMVGWSRIYLGVHFPFDMAGGLLTAIMGLLAVLPFRPIVEGPILRRVVLPAYQRVFAWPISRRLCRS